MARTSSKTMARSTTSSGPSSRLTPQELRSLIEKKAYEIYQKRGCTPGNTWADWFEAERIIKRHYSIK